MAWRSAGARARGWARSRCGTGAGRAGAGLARWRRYQLACATPAARHAARVPIRGAIAVIASAGHGVGPGSLSALSESFSKSA